MCQHQPVEGTRTRYFQLAQVSRIVCGNLRMIQQVLKQLASEVIVSSKKSLFYFFVEKTKSLTCHFFPLGMTRTHRR